MLKGKKDMIIIFLLLGFIVAIFHATNNNNDVVSYKIEDNEKLENVKKTINLKLPDDAKVEEYTDFYEGGYYEIKVCIKEKDVADVKNQLDKIFIPNFFDKEGISDESLKSLSGWWNLKAENIDAAYSIYFNGEENQTIQCNVFITKESNSSYYLYISYI